MPQMEVTLRQLNYLLQVQEKASFTAAADLLGITQPALSIAIAQLEEAVGATLVERGTRPVTLTEVGEIMAACAQRVSREIKLAREEIGALESGSIGRLDICMSPSATGTAVTEVLSQMVEEFPLLEIHISHGVLPAAADRLHSGDISVLLGTSADNQQDKALKIDPLLDVDMLVVAGAGHPLSRKKKVALEDLTAHPWIQIGDIRSNFPEWGRTFTRAKLDQPRLAVDIRNITLVREMLMQGKLLTVLPRPLVEADLKAGLLCSVTPPNLGWSLTFNAVTSTIKRPPSAVRIFLERLTERIGAPKYKSSK
ncbi:LysR family transcriptional regulator [Altererythrobacter arenosus]|uniref:LysR family transcriptional regulator n=1 Tax=Altererythrobacter arenosus TaxID=3032592 RepID=A0ABY8FXU0_9SPHN|nr:LysR family transcriptional regulator [Altererythrobacter sp. CAU 1644]WFL79060.1 LysR family transcriptional regulator [Altererythrobacter sp. CAU 1644]